LEEISVTLPKVKLLMSAVGGVEVIPESLMNAAGAISGSGPAYVSIATKNYVSYNIGLIIPYQ